MQPTIIRRRCPAQDNVCKAIPACPKSAIRYVADESEPLGGKIVFEYELCDACGTCVQECCGSAIEMH